MFTFYIENHEHFGSLIEASNELFFKKAVGILLGKLIHFLSCWQDEIQLLGDYLKISFLIVVTSAKRKIMNVHDKIHIIHSCWEAGWQKY